MLAYLEKTGLFFKLKKYKFHKKSIIFLKFVIIIKNIKIDSKKIKTVQKLAYIIYGQKNIKIFRIYKL